jgi:hypothetical protein
MKTSSHNKTVITGEKAVGIDIFLRTAQTVNKDMKWFICEHFASLEENIHH